MKRAIKIALLTFGAFAIGACITVDGILASGRVHDVSTADIPTAIAVDIRTHPNLALPNRTRLSRAC